MTSTPASPRLRPAAPAGLAPGPWRPLGAALLLVVVAFGPTLLDTVRRWWEDPEYSHGFLMPFVAWWLLHTRRERLRALGGGTSALAPVVLLLCLVACWVAQMDFLFSLAPFAFVGALGAVLLAFLGWPGLVASAPALVVLALACPLPGPVEQGLTLPLKATSARFAIGLLDLTGVPSFLDGSVIHLENADSLLVADACSGIRSLVSLLSLSVIACLVWRRHWALKLAVLLAAVPIAVLVNGARIWLTGYLSVHAGPETAEGAFHFFEGFALFALAGLLLLGFAALLGVLFPRRGTR